MNLNPRELTPDLLEKLDDIVNDEFNPTRFLAIDPGKTNGVCGYDIKYHLQFMYSIPADGMNSFLYVFKKIKLVIIEDFLLYPNKMKQQVYSDMETPRIIGRVEGWAERVKVDLVKQGAKIKPTGYAWIGEKPLPKSNPNNHVLDAHVHFMYWAVKSGKINATDLLKPRRPAQ